MDPTLTDSREVVAHLQVVTPAEAQPPELVTCHGYDPDADAWRQRLDLRNDELHVFERRSQGLTFAEIARELGMTRGAISGLAASGRRKLRAKTNEQAVVRLIDLGLLLRD